MRKIQTAQTQWLHALSHACIVYIATAIHIIYLRTDIHHYSTQTYNQKTLHKPTHAYTNLQTPTCLRHIHIYTTLHTYTMGWLRSVGSIKFQVSFAGHRLFYRSFFAKETYDFIDPTNRSHPIPLHTCTTVTTYPPLHPLQHSTSVDL